MLKSDGADQPAHPHHASRNLLTPPTPPHLNPRLTAVTKPLIYMPPKTNKRKAPQKARRRQASPEPGEIPVASSAPGSPRPSYADVVAGLPPSRSPSPSPQLTASPMSQSPVTQVATEDIFATARERYVRRSIGLATTHECLTSPRM